MKFMLGDANNESEDLEIFDRRNLDTYIINKTI